MNSIAIESEYGSGGLQIGQLISSELNMAYYDGKALIKAAKDFQYPLTLLKNYELNEASHILYCLAIIAKQPEFRNDSKIKEVFDTMKKTIRMIDKQQSAVFTGYCASKILGDRDIHSVFIYASNPNDRISRIIQEKNISKKQAVAIIKQEDNYRENYYGVWTKMKWHECNGYDMALNTSKISIERCVGILIKEMQAGK